MNNDKRNRGAILGAMPTLRLRVTLPPTANYRLYCLDYPMGLQYLRNGIHRSPSQIIAPPDFLLGANI